MTPATSMSDSAPHVNASLERQALGQIIGYPTGWDLYAAAGLCETDFFSYANRLEYRAITAVAAAGVTPDLVTVAAELRRVGHLEEVGPAYHAGLIDGLPPAKADTAAFVVTQLARLASLRNLAAAVARGDVEAVAPLADAAMTRAAGSDRIYTANQQLEQLRIDTRRDDAGRVWLGFPSLDNIVGGIRAGEVVGWMARPGIGKTLVFCHVAQCVAEHDMGHVFFSLEMPAPQIIDRIAGSHFGMTRFQLRERLSAGVLDGDGYERAFRSFVLVDAPGLDVATMAAKLRQIQAGPLRGTPIRLVTIDHLGLIGGDRRMNTYDRVSTQARELKELAKRLNIAVLLAVQVNREAGGDGSKELHLGSARDSGVVEEAMDYLIAMRRLDRSQTLSLAEREKYRDVLFAKVVKNRHGAPDAEIAIRIDPQTLQLREDASVQLHEDDIGRLLAQGRGRR